MTARRVLHVMSFALFAVVAFVLTAHSQPSTAPPSSLPTMPLEPNTNDPARPATCDLCRPLEGRPGSDLQRHRRLRQKHLHLHKKAPGVTKSPKRSLTSQLPRRKLEEEHENEDR